MVARKKLTARQEKFCHEYMIDLNGTAAARRAGYSEKSARVVGCENLTKPAIAKKISELAEKNLKAQNVTVQKVVSELARIAFLDIRKIYDDDGKLRPIHLLDEDTARAIAGVEVTQMADGRTKTKVKTIDKSRSLEILAKHLGMLVERVSHEGNVGNVVIVMPDNGRQEPKEVTVEKDLKIEDRSTS